MTQSSRIKVLDLCTGSGCIAISLAKYAKEAQVEASDISSKALTVARKNAQKNDVTVHWIESDLFENIEGTYDIIVSNPPYIATKMVKQLQKEVQKEPLLALDGGLEGLEFYEKIAQEARLYLASKGWILFEIGFDQAQAVTQILQKNGFQVQKTVQDYGKHDRVVVAKRG